MFANMLRVPQREYFNKLKEAKAAAPPHKPTFICATHTHACIERTIATVDRLLEWRQDWLKSSHPARVHHARKLELFIDRDLADARFRLSQLTRQQARRGAAACVVQRAALRWLYTPRHGGIPPIGRSLVRDGVLATGDVIGALGDGAGKE